VNAAVDLFQRRGFVATGLNEITRHGRAPKGSLYFHFPGGKEQLASEAMVLAGARYGAMIRAVVDGASDTPAAINALARLMAAGLERSGFEVGCPVATTALEVAATSPAVAAAADAAFDGWQEVIADRMRRDGRSRHEASRRATLILAALEGALILARAKRSPRPLIDAAAELAELLS
jgi:TetR/AcrR family transcriptional repressor of lmrAB and yxaGH operons